MKMLSEQKKSLRNQLRQLLREITAEQWQQESHAAAQRLAATEAFEEASAIMIFLPILYEIDARPLALRAWQMGKTVAIPLVEQGSKRLTPVIVNSLEEPMDVDAYGLCSPRNPEPLPVEMLDLVVVPGLGFDRQGRRIGRGGGFYDRFLSEKEFHGTACGFAVHQQVIKEIPADPRDVNMNMLVTDQELLTFSELSVARRG